MSWTTYIDSMVQQGIPMCGIYLKDTGQVCAQTENMKVMAADIELIRSCLSGEGSKLDINGQSCVMTQSNETYVKGKTKAKCLDGDKVFFHCETSTKFIVIAGKNGAGERLASKVCSKVAEHLKASGC